MNESHILWRRIDIEGREACRMSQSASGWSLRGNTIYREHGLITAVTYQIDHDDRWCTHAARVSGWSGNKRIDLQIIQQADGIWSINDRMIASLEGCIDVDLGFSPATNTSAIRRLIPTFISFDRYWPSCGMQSSKFFRPHQPLPSRQRRRRRECPHRCRRPGSRDRFAARTARYSRPG